MVNWCFKWDRGSMGLHSRAEYIMKVWEGPHWIVWEVERRQIKLGYSRSYTFILLTALTRIWAKLLNCSRKILLRWQYKRRRKKLIQHDELPCEKKMLRKYSVIVLVNVARSCSSKRSACTYSDIHTSYIFCGGSNKQLGLNYKCISPKVEMLELPRDVGRCRLIR